MATKKIFYNKDLGLLVGGSWYLGGGGMRAVGINKKGGGGVG